MFVCCFRLVFLAFAFTIEKTHIKTWFYILRNKKKKEKLKGKHKKKKHNLKEKKKHLPARPLEIFIFRGGSRSGYPVFMCFFVFRVVLFLFMFLSGCCLFSPSLFKLLHLQTNKYI